MADIGRGFRVWLGGVVTVWVTAIPLNAGVISYETSGTIGTAGISGPNVLTFEPTSGISTTFGSLSLGTFNVSSSGVSGVSTTFQNTPFSITFTPKTVENQPSGSVFPSLTIHGHLDGWVGALPPGAEPSLMGIQATFDSLTSPIVLQSDSLGPIDWLSLSVNSRELSLNVPGSTSLGAILQEAVWVPEPTSIALFAVVGLALLARTKAIRRH